MAIDLTRAAIELIRGVVTSVGFTMSGYAVETTQVTITLTKDAKGTDELARTLSESRLTSLLGIYGWTVSSVQFINDNLIATATKRRTVAGII